MTDRDPAKDTNEQFLDRLRDLAMNWRYSNELIGLVVRCRWAMDAEPIATDTPTEKEDTTP
jgi:hypothetical protein